jgi:type II secretory pathway component PulF
MLDKALEKIAEYKEKQEELKNQLKSALAYPILLVITGVVTIFILISFVIPKFIEMFQDIGQILPLRTRILIGISSFMGRFWWIISVLFALVILGIKYLLKKKKVKMAFDKFKLNLPLIGELFKNLETSHICYTLGNLLERGIPIMEALTVTAETSKNTFYSNTLLSFQKGVKEGDYLSNCLKENKLFPPLVGSMIGVGEESGELSDMLFKIASIYEKRVNQNIKTLLSLLEPTLILILGSIIGLVVWAILLPIFQMNILIE